VNNTRKSVPFTDVDNQYRIPPDVPDWDVKEIIYLNASPTMTADGLSFVWMRNSGVISLNRTMTYDEFLKRLLANDLPPLHSLHEHRKKKPGSLDFRIERNAYVFVELARHVNWEFRKDWDGLSTNHRRGLYTQLVHFDAYGNPYKGEGIRPADNPHPPSQRRHPCNIAAFAAKARPDKEPWPSDSLNIYVQLNEPRQPEGGMLVILDPDVENPGGPPHFGNGNGNGD
jgi:hypothetical protein